VPRQRTARLPLLTSSAGRSEGSSPQGARAVRARLVAIALVILSLALITVYLRESTGGVLHGAQRIAVSVVTPFEVAGERISRPFRDAWGWASDLVGAKNENAKLRRQVQELRREVVENRNAVRENEQYREMLRFRDGPRFPSGYTGVATRVIARPPSIYAQDVVVAAGSSDGVETNNPVVTPDGLVGLVTEVTGNASKVTLLTDQESAVSALDAESGASGIVRRGPSDTSVLVLDRVGKDEQVGENDKVVTAGWKTGKLESLFPRGIPIGIVSGVGQQDVDLYKRVQVTPLVNFDSLDNVIVLVAKSGGDHRRRP